ncbi:MAG: hypothetical protein K2Q18_01030 [Bdellovibrionales bacterium]|nr:hypothetical protein [Bdellovibrionales bacterium]
MKYLFFSLLLMMQIADVFALDQFNPSCFDGGLGLPPKIEKMSLSSDVMACVATKELYKCEELKADLEDSDKYKVIECNEKALEANRLGNVSLIDCAWEGVKLSGQQLLDLKNLAGSIAEGIAKSFKETQVCNSSLDKKRELLKAFNLTIEDKRFKLEEKFLGRWLEDAPCSEIDKLVSARYQNYQNTLARERFSAQLTGQKVASIKAQKSEGPGIIEMLKAAMQEAGVKYQCYTPKVKAEMLCAGVTSFLVDAAFGGAAAMAIRRVVQSKKALGRIERAVAAGEKANLKDAGALLNGDRLKAAELILGRKITDEERRAIIASHNVAKDKGFGAYTAEDIAKKARELKKVKTIKVTERRDLMENGITGVELKNGHAVRIKGEKLIGEAYERGMKDRIAEGLKETRKFYKEVAELGDADFAKMVTPDGGGLSFITRANEYGLTVKETAKAVSKIIRVHGLDELQSLQTVASDLSDTIAEYAKMNVKKYSTQLENKMYRAKELKAEIMEEYFAKKYPDKYKELDFDKMDPKEQELLNAIREDLQKERKIAEKKGWSRE